MRTKLLIASTLFAALWITPQVPAAPAGETTASADKAQPALVKPITREDVELLLREARGAITQGEIDRAEKLVSKAENARIHYSMFHFGPTPASVRRELNRARRAAGPESTPSANTETSARSPFIPFGKKGDASTRATVDPFATATLPPDTSSRLSGAATAQIADAETSSENADAEQTAPAGQLQRLPSLGNTQPNPFAKPLANNVAPARYEVQPTQAAQQADQNQPADQQSADVSWTLPDAQPTTQNGETLPELPTVEAPTSSPRLAAAAPATGPSSLTPKQQALSQMAEARQALDAGNIEEAEKLSRAVNALGVPESEFLPEEDRPSLLAWDIVAAKKSQVDPIERAKMASARARRSPPSARYADGSNSIALPNTESSRIAENAVPLPQVNAAPAAIEELPLPDFSTPLAKAPSADGRHATDAHAAPAAPPSLIDKADETQQLLARQLSTEIGKRQSEAKRLHTQDPERAVAILREAQQLVKDSKLPVSSQRELLTRIDITLKQTEKYIKQHGADIELDKQNEKVLQSIDREREVERKIKQEIADGIQEINKLRDEHRYAEMEIVARRLYELDPDDPTVQQVLQTTKFIRREMLNREISMQREEGNVLASTDTLRATTINVGDENPLSFDKERWTDFVKPRIGKDSARRRTEREIEIEKKLKMPVQLRYEGTPLGQVVDELSKLAGINIYLDPRGLSQEGVNSETTVDLPLNKEISLESALNLILGPLHLSYVVKDDVLKITSEQLRDGEIFAVTYNVADLVIPIPNFVPSSNIGLQGLINDAMAASNAGHRTFGAVPGVLVNTKNQAPGSAATDQILAQQFNPGPSGVASPSTVPIGAGPGGMGAGANADFDSLIDLIVSTVSTETWAENGGGEAEIRPFPTNLSLVISQTQAVHEEIADLLEQLRRLQDLQVTIEVRFIRLNDSFFERIGIDFDLDVDDTGVDPTDPNSPFEPIGTQRSNTVGLVRSATDATFPTFSSDLDIPFRQNSFDLTQLVPFGGPVGGGLNFGFAILSDIEAYFLIEAAQGDSRTNVLNAPKVTLFNGQQAFVSDATQRPFVVGVIPVVGEFAAAQQPVIVVLNEGTMMTIQAVVSEDRRYVRMTIVPFFTQIGDVDEFTFEGSSSSTSSSSSTDDDDDGKNESEEESEEETRSGVTVQLPSFSFVSVVTTVSVPDGGTVLLGGIKRLSEGRNEFGVPLLSKVPYINRLFRNIAIGRETDSLMMMVTPRIIIQEEEEERLGIQVP
jgi:general secretion pathway protein D